MMRVMKWIVLSFSFLGFIGCSHIPMDRETVFQQSTIDALLQANYQSDFTFAGLKKRGDFGIGTFRDLDGEMLAYEGVFYQVKSDGNVYPVEDSMTTPFAAVTFFEADQVIALEALKDYAALETFIDTQLPTLNIFYAIKIEGIFSTVKVRSVPKQTKPYQPLIEVVKAQPVYTYENVKGTLIGFRSPSFVKGINVPKYHLHFINAEKTRGGHVLACGVKEAKLEIDQTHGFAMHLPNNAQFYKTNLNHDQSDDLKKVEK